MRSMTSMTASLPPTSLSLSCSMLTCWRRFSFSCSSSSIRSSSSSSRSSLHFLAFLDPVTTGSTSGTTTCFARFSFTAVGVSLSTTGGPTAFAACSSSSFFRCSISRSCSLIFFSNCAVTVCTALAICSSTLALDFSALGAFLLVPSLVSTLMAAGMGLVLGMFLAFSSSSAFSRALLAERSSFSTLMCFSACARSSSSSLAALPSCTGAGALSAPACSCSRAAPSSASSLCRPARSSCSFAFNSWWSCSIFSCILFTCALAFSSCERSTPTCGSSKTTGSTSTGSLPFACSAWSLCRSCASSPFSAGSWSSRPAHSSRRDCARRRSCAASSRHWPSSSLARFAASASRAAAERRTLISAWAFFSWCSISSASWLPRTSSSDSDFMRSPPLCSSLIFSSTTSLTKALVCSSRTYASGS
mmetsp:Transcript_9326/g.26217  ORF Transcript_9326/g.26217 Transcript_9326/m.26217 type:complete len:418 (-) Transcript_9326:561-1814(-)